MSESLVRVHGEEVADGIMSMLPTVDWDQIVTKDYLDARFGKFEAHLERRLRQQTTLMFVALLFSPALSQLVEHYFALFS